jgi:predicted ABC-class ATPase
LGHPLRELFERLDGRSYSSYKEMKGESFAIGPLGLRMTRVQADPYAAPSQLRIDIPEMKPPLPEWAIGTLDQRRATADYLHRFAEDRLPIKRVDPKRGSGKEGHLDIAPIGPEVLDRTAVRVGADGSVIFRISLGLPARGRRIQGKNCARLFFDVIAQAFKRTMRVDLDELAAHVHAIEDQVALRGMLVERDLVGFIADGSILPRMSGADQRPLPDAVPFISPDALAVTLTRPHGGDIRGLGVPTGVTLIVGGGYHGKSTVLQALSRSVYDHAPGDGRELCVARASAVSIRAEDGRAVSGVDLRPFISDLPGGRDTAQFYTADASGSTSQAAAIVEALEAGADTLLIDEDTAATNFMIRDARMRRLVPSDGEPITPYIDRVRQLAANGISSVLVVGGAGDYLDVADMVLRMDAFVARDVTAQAKALAIELPLGDAAPKAPGPWPDAARRVPNPASLDPSRGKHSERVYAITARLLQFGPNEIDLGALSQLIDGAQTRMIADTLLYLARGIGDGKRDLVALLDLVDATLDEGLSTVAAFETVDRARPRRFEIAGALNRLRVLTLIGGPQPDDDDDDDADEG